MTLIPIGPDGNGVFGVTPAATAWSSATTYPANSTVTAVDPVTGGTFQWFSLIDGNLNNAPTTADTTTWQVSELSLDQVNHSALSAGLTALKVLTTLGDLIYGGIAGLFTRLAGNATTTKKFLSQTGTGTASAAPVWGTLAGADLPIATILAASNDAGANSIINLSGLTLSSGAFTFADSTTQATAYPGVPTLAAVISAGDAGGGNVSNVGTFAGTALSITGALADGTHAVTGGGSITITNGVITAIT